MEVMMWDDPRLPMGMMLSSRSSKTFTHLQQDRQQTVVQAHSIQLVKQPPFGVRGRRYKQASLDLA